MRHFLLPALLSVLCIGGVHAQSCNFDSQIVVTDSLLCAGDSTTLSFNLDPVPGDTVLPTAIVNNNGQDGNMFDITAPIPSASGISRAILQIRPTR